MPCRHQIQSSYFQIWLSKMEMNYKTLTLTTMFDVFVRNNSYQWDVAKLEVNHNSHVLMYIIEWPVHKQIINVHRPDPTTQIWPLLVSSTYHTVQKCRYLIHAENMCTGFWVVLEKQRLIFRLLEKFIGCSHDSDNEQVIISHTTITSNYSEIEKTSWIMIKW